jgi:hypothetical protein
MIGCTSWLVPGTWLENARLAQGLVDYDELLVANWDSETRETLERELPELLKLDLQYAIHLPMTDAAQAWDAFQFFEERRIPVLNYVLHPLPQWRTYSSVSYTHLRAHESEVAGDVLDGALSAER